MLKGLARLKNVYIAVWMGLFLQLLFVIVDNRRLLISEPRVFSVDLARLFIFLVITNRFRTGLLNSRALSTHSINRLQICATASQRTY